MKYCIYQIKRDSAEGRNVKFMNLHQLKRMGIKPTMDMYNKVYEGELDDWGRAETILEKIYHKFNMNYPADFKGHSLSVSDVVGLYGCYYYCDAFGFKSIDL